MSALEKYAHPEHEGCYQDKDGCYHDTIGTLIQCGVLGFCGCGRPEDNLALLLTRMEAIADETDGRFQCGPEMHFIDYTLDKLGFLEHGGSLPGWLSESGKELLELLRIWKAEESQP